MNANKLAKRVKKAKKRYIKDELKEIKQTILSVADIGDNKVNKDIKFTENIDWLRKKGFKVEKGEYSYSSCRISWEDC